MRGGIAKYLKNIDIIFSRVRIKICFQDFLILNHVQYIFKTGIFFIILFPVRIDWHAPGLILNSRI